MKILKELLHEITLIRKELPTLGICQESRKVKTKVKLVNGEPRRI